MIDKSRETVFERTYKQLDQQISEYARTESVDSDNFFAKLKALKWQQAKIAEILKKQEQEEANFAEEKMQAIFGDDPVYQKAKEAWDEELLQKFHDRRLTRDEYLKLSKTHKLDLWVDYYYQSLERFDQISDFRDGFAPVKIGDKRGFINEQWEQICEAKYDFVSYPKNGIARVKIGDKRWFINIK